jgi:hypothetical protein
MSESFWINGLYWLTGGVGLASFALVVFSVTNSIRLRNVRLTWNSGRIAGYPLFSSLFLMVMAAVTLTAVVHSDVASYPLVIGYSWIGVHWFLGSHLASRRYITDHGIVKNINEPSQTVAWNQIVDHVSQPAGRHTAYTFFFRVKDAKGMLSGPLLRLELQVPSRRLDDFRRLIDLKLGGQHPEESESKRHASFAD